MNTNGVLNNQIKMFDKNMNHFGLDIAVRATARNKSEYQLELKDFDLLNKGFIMSSSEFPRDSIAQLFDTVINKYFSTSKTDDSDVNKVSELPINGKVIKAIRKNGEKHEVVTHDPNPSEEMKTTINRIIELKGAADLKMQEQMIKCADALRVGTLDMTNSTNLVVHTKEGAEKLNGKVTRDQLIATIWFITKAYMIAPSFRKHLNVSVSDDKYSIGYKNGVPFVDQSNLNELEKGIISDLISIKE
jgi:hypothetical protein